jgi:SWI/SNF-related matrix-associated actin-dependent regulator 1 of chromatin subfamily A
MQLIVEKSKYHAYAFVFPFSLDALDFCRKLKDQYGWRNFSFVQGKWRFADLGIAWIIKEKYPAVVASPEMQVKMDFYKSEKLAERDRTKAALEIKDKKEASIDIKGLKLPLYEYQKIGVEFFINNNGRAILADAPGAGKSFQALAYLVHEQIQKAVVVCPASVKYSWKSEVIKWTHLKPFVISSNMKLIDVIKGVADANVVIINYDILGKFIKFLVTIKFEAMICDESHYLKTPTAVRTKMVKQLVENISKKLLLSGTPMLSRPVELFTSLQIIDPINWVSYHEYTVRYCNGHNGPWGWDARGASNLEELNKKICRYYIRRNKSDILPELPPKRYIDRVVELNKEHRFMYDLAEESLSDYLKEVKNKSDGEIEKSMFAEKLVQLNELRSITTSGKLEQAKEIIDEVVDGGEKILVFSCYNEPLEKLFELYSKESVIITGQTKDVVRQMAIEEFQNNPNRKIFFGGIKSAGVGITLTAASTVLFLDYSWTPADHIQAADRVHRPGQTAESITIYQMVAQDTIDSDMQELLAEKQGIINAVLEQNSNETIEAIDLRNDLINRFDKKHD